MDNNNSEILLENKKKNINSLNSSLEEKSKSDINNDDLYAPQPVIDPKITNQYDVTIQPQNIKPYNPNIYSNSETYEEQKPTPYINNYNNKVVTQRYYHYKTNNTEENSSSNKCLNVLMIISSILLLIFLTIEIIFLISNNKFLEDVFVTIDEILILICAIFFFINKKITIKFIKITSILALICGILGIPLRLISVNFLYYAKEYKILESLLGFLGFRTFLLLISSFITCGFSTTLKDN